MPSRIEDDPVHWLIGVKCRKITHGYCTLKIEPGSHFISNYTTRDSTNRDCNAHNSTGLIYSYICLLFSSSRDGKKCIATVASIFNQQQQAISISTFTQNRYLEHKRPSLFKYADKNGSTITYVTILIFIANPTFRFYSPVQNCLCLY